MTYIHQNAKKKKKVHKYLIKFSASNSAHISNFFLFLDLQHGEKVFLH